MDIITLIMLVVGVGMLFVAFIIEGGNLSSFAHISPFMIILGGTFGAVGVSFPGEVLKKFPKVLMKAFSNKKMDRKEILDTFMALSTTARRDGLLALEHELEVRELDDLTKTGLRLVIDGADEDVLRQILETRIINMVHRHEKGIAMFEAAGGYSPTMGVIGTVMGMITVLGKMGESTDLGGEIATAFIATFLGVGLANLIWLPIASKLKELNSDEVLACNMIIEAIQLLRTGSNPAFMKEQLKGYLEHEDEGETQEGEQ
ncbi:MAG TPA: motility protein A [Mobilitalea sp.]|nr:motility protein A [Mobilitalea sp.]